MWWPFAQVPRAIADDGPDVRAACRSAGLGAEPNSVDAHIQFREIDACLGQRIAAIAAGKMKEEPWHDLCCS